MVLPDLGLICEIMLMAEGFQSSKLLSRKFVILYKLCEVRRGSARHCPHRSKSHRPELQAGCAAAGAAATGGQCVPAAA